MPVMSKRFAVTAPLAALSIVLSCTLTGCGGKDAAETSGSGGGPGAVSSKPNIPPEAQAQINAQQRRESADRTARMPKTGP